tara:strand:+ start:1363 stop:2379 length:1017 start_codon:yes stop_codon:yes gene_type:complete
MANQVNRQRSLCIAREDDAAKGTAVAASTGHFLTFESGILKGMADPVINEESAGVLEAGLETFANKEWSELTFKSIVKADWLGHVLTGLLGGVSSANSPGESACRDHDITVSQSVDAPAYTFFMLGTLTSEKATYGTFKRCTLECNADGVLTAEVEALAQAMESGSGTNSFATDNHFQGSHLTVKHGANTSDLAGANGVGFHSLSLTIERDVQPHFAFGSNEPNKFIAGSLRIRGTLQLLRTGLTYRDYFTDGTFQAFRFDFEDTATTIGSSTPTYSQLLFDLDKCQIIGHDITDAADDQDIETIEFQAMYDLDEGTPRMCYALIANTESTTAYTEPA